MAPSTTTTTISDLPDVILFTIISSISDVRSRNSASLVSRKWLYIDRSTRTSLTLRGNSRHLFLLPSSFHSILHLDLSFLSPYGHPFLPDYPQLHLLSQSFPKLLSLVIYSRTPLTLQLLTPLWPRLKSIKLVRWHQRPTELELQLPPGADLLPVFKNCSELNVLDLSTFYCWTEDVTQVLTSYPVVSTNITELNLLNPAFPEGFKADEVTEITKCCINLKRLWIVCVFDPRYVGFVGDEAMVSVVTNCPKLEVLHLADPVALRGEGGEVDVDAGVTVPGLVEAFSGMKMIEELTVDISTNVRDSGPALEVLNTKCTRLKRLKVGNFHGVSVPVESKLDGVALCQRLESLSIRNVADLTDLGLIAIARGCCKLTRFEIQGCGNVTVRGMRTFACLLSKTLTEVKISRCRNLGATLSLKALEPVQDRIRKLHIDCVWGDSEPFDDDLDQVDQVDDDELDKKRKKQKLDFDLNDSVNTFQDKRWEKLKHLSLWFSVGELLTPLLSSGLEDCPNLEEIFIKVEGDCRHFSKPAQREFGLRALAFYPKLSKMQLDCGDVIGYAHTAPSGQMDLSLWERFYLFGIRDLNLVELDYWPPQDRDVNQRSLSLPAAGLLQECFMLRKLFIHGTTHEHFLMFLLRIPNLRDVQLREDYYPAPENDMSTEMRADSCSRFEEALNRRRIAD